MTAARTSAAAAVLALLVGAGPAQDAPPSRPPAGPDPAPPALPVEVVVGADASEPDVLDLAGAAWSRDGEPAEPQRVTLPAPPAGASANEAGTARAAVLDFSGLGTRWTTTITCERPRSVRLLLRARGGPDGLLVEALLDGRRLRPAHDTWRPAARALRFDLGPAWLGPGEHLLEIVGREKVGHAKLPVTTLELRAP